MAKKGLFLSDAETLYHYAVFEKGEPRRLKYRLQCEEAPKPGSTVSVEREMNMLRSWEHICSFSYYEVYRSEAPEPPELIDDEATRRRTAAEQEAIFRCATMK